MGNEELVLKIQSGENKSKNIELLYTQNVKFIRKIAAKYSGYEDIEDLVQEGYFGLVTAAECWSPDKGANFISYAYYWIRQAIRRYLDNCGSVIRIPTNQKERIFQYRQAVEKFVQDFGRDPSSRELASMLKITIDQIETIRRDAQFLQLKSTNETIAEDLTLEDTIQDPDDEIEGVLDKVQREELSSLLWSLVNELKDIESAVIKKRYKDGRTLRQCGADLGLEFNRVHSIEQGAMNKLRKRKVIKQLEPFLEERRAYLAYQGTGLRSFRTTWTSSPERVAMLLHEQQYRQLCKDKFEMWYRKYLDEKYK